MNILKKLFQKKDDRSKSTELKQIEREAIVDLLLLAMYADNHVSYEESKHVNDATEKLGWESSIDILSYMNETTGKARKVRSDSEGKDHYLNDVAKRLSSPQSKELALKLLHDLFHSDGQFDDGEEDLFKVVEAKLKI